MVQDEDCAEQRGEFRGGEEGDECEESVGGGEGGEEGVAGLEEGL